MYVRGSADHRSLLRGPRRGAAALLADRPERHRRTFPELPADLDYGEEIASLLAEGATGAYTEGAYVVGRPDTGDPASRSMRQDTPPPSRNDCGRLGRPEETPDEIRADVLDDFVHEDVVNLVYELDGRIVGDFSLSPVELSAAHSGPARPPGATLLAFAATDPEVRGRGMGVALTDASFAWARRRGYRTMLVDWRVTNLLASRFWPQRGFRATFLRLHRRIGAISVS